MIHRLLLRAWAPRLLAALAALVAVYVAVELADLSNVAGAPPLSRYPLRVPLALTLAMPVALVAAGCWAGVHLARTGQLVAMAAAGVDPRVGLLAVPVAGLLAGALLFANADLVSPLALARWRGSTEDDPRGAGWASSGPLLFQLEDPRAAAGEPRALAFELDGRGLPLSRIEAAGARAVPGRGLELEGAVVFRPGQAPEGPVTRLTLPAPDAEAPVRLRPEELPGPDLARAIAAARRSGLDASPAAAERGLRLAVALACPLTALLGILAGALLGRRPAVAAAAGAASALLCWAAIATSWSLAASGALAWPVVAAAAPALLGPPAAAAWLAGLPRAG